MYNVHEKEMRAPPEEYENFSLNHKLFDEIDICNTVESRRLLQDMNEESKRTADSDSNRLLMGSGVSHRRSALKTVANHHNRSQSGNSCCSTGSAAKKSRQEIQHVHSELVHQGDGISTSVQDDGVETIIDREVFD